ncbi:glycosyltransferase family 2 protein [Candidatus Sumerlaeota bacterium]|nr:glycosyltransferase family 2 protein [Candidatus Sumerlaeota bacterium]
MTRLAIAIVHYRSERLLRECLEALRRSSEERFRVCVVDNGSCDGLAWVEEMDARFDLVRSEESIGFAAATNRALDRLADDAPYVTTLNPDVTVEPDTLEGAMRALDSDPSIGAVTCRLVLPDGRIDPACRRGEPTLVSAFSKLTGLQRLFPQSRFFGRYNMTHVDATHAHDIQSGTCAFLMIRRGALDSIAEGRLDERFFMYGEDLDLCRRLREAGYRILYTPEVRATHVKGSGRIRAFRTTFHFYRSMWLYYRKWGRHRRNPAVLLPLAAAIALLAGLEIVRTAVRRVCRRCFAARSTPSGGMGSSCGS